MIIKVAGNTIQPNNQTIVDCVYMFLFLGEVLWTVEDDNFIAANWNIYQALPLQDWDLDGVIDILIVNGGDPMKDPEVCIFLMTHSRLVTTLKKKHFENVVGKGENAGNQYFLLFPQYFLPYQRQQ